MRTNKRIRKLIVQFTEYMISGGAWFWVGYGAFAVVDKVFPLPFLPTKFRCYIIGASSTFLLQSVCVMIKEGRKKKLGDAL